MRSLVPWMYAVQRILLLLLSPVFVACGGDDAGGLMGPSIPSVAGSWTYNMTNLSGGGLRGCSATGTSMIFTQSARRSRAPTVAARSHAPVEEGPPAPLLGTAPSLTAR